MAVKRRRRRRKGKDREEGGEWRCVKELEEGRGFSRTFLVILVAMLSPTKNLLHGIIMFFKMCTFDKYATLDLKNHKT